MAHGERFVGRLVRPTPRQRTTDIIETLERTYRRRTHGDHMLRLSQQSVHCPPRDRKVLRVHRMTADRVALDGAEGARADV